MPHQDATLRRTIRRRFVLIAVTALGGLALSLVLYVGTAIRDRQLEETQFNLGAGLRVEAIQRAVANRLVIVDMLVAFYAQRGFSDPRRVSHVHALRVGQAPRDPLLGVGLSRSCRRTRGVRAVGPRTRPGRLSHYARAGEAFTPGGELVPASERSEYFPILFHEPIPPGYRLFGFDVATIPAFKSAIKGAIVSRGATAIVRPPLDGHNTRAHQLYIFRKPRPKERNWPAQGERAVRGLAVGSFEIDRIVEDALEYYQPAISVYIFDASSGSAAPIYAACDRFRRGRGRGEVGGGCGCEPDRAFLPRRQRGRSRLDHCLRPYCRISGPASHLSRSS